MPRGWTIIPPHSGVRVRNPPPIPPVGVTYRPESATVAARYVVAADAVQVVYAFDGNAALHRITLASWDNWVRSAKARTDVRQPDLMPIGERLRLEP